MSKPRFDNTEFSKGLFETIKQIESVHDLKVAKYMIKQRKRELSGKKNKAARMLEKGY